MEASVKLIKSYLIEFPKEAARQMNSASLDDFVEVIHRFSLSTYLPMLEHMFPDVIAKLSHVLPEKEFKHILCNLSAQMLAKILPTFDGETNRKYLKMLPKSLRDEVQEIAAYPHNTVGHIMDSSVLRFSPEMTVSQAIEKIKSHTNKNTRVIFTVNEKDQLQAMIPLQSLIMEDSSSTLSSLGQRIPCIVRAMSFQDELVERLEKHQMTDVPVVDNEEHFVGAIRYTSIIEATKAEISKDIQTMVGVSEDESALSTVLFSVRKRLPWLEINLLTAFLAAAVVGLFESTIAKYTALAVLLPVVAGQSGNTGAQALAVTMRGLALKEIRVKDWFRLMFKEFKIALFTGVAVSLPTSLGVFVWSKSYGLALIIAVSMIVSMLIASVSGAAVPLLLAKFKQDPASSSSIILTTVTDVFGFFSFLGIANALSHLI